MAEILLGYRVEYYDDQTPVESYARSFHRALEEKGHHVFPIGEGHANKSFNGLSDVVIRSSDLFIDLDTGRNAAGNLHFQLQSKASIPTAVWFIDSHGHPSLHKRLSKHYDYTFFAVWDKRDLFTKHPSAHWCPNASDARWFFPQQVDAHQFTIGFYGTRGGLHRADLVKQIVKRHKESAPPYIADIREIGRKSKKRWPETANAMAQCKMLFNKGQKHDSPNQRTIESMLCLRPLINDRDPRSGMSKLFEEGVHYLGWAREPELADQIRWTIENYDLAMGMAFRAYKEVINKHLVEHRVEQILEVCL